MNSNDFKDKCTHVSNDYSCTIVLSESEYYEVILKLNNADRSRTRVTADELPTREDADKDGWVLAHLLAPMSKAAIWAVALWNSVASDSEFYTEWTQLPTVTGKEPRNE